MEDGTDTGGDVEVVRLQGDGAEALLTLFAQVAEQEGWQPGDQLRAFSGQAQYFAIFVEGQLAGGVQTIVPDDGGILPYQAVWPDVSLSSADGVAEVTVLALAREYRGRPDLFWHLCAELWRFCVTSSIRTVILEATPIMLKRYRRIGWPLEVIGELRTHWGDLCFLCSLDVRCVGGSLLELALRSTPHRSLIYRAITPRRTPRCAVEPALP